MNFCRGFPCLLREDFPTQPNPQPPLPLSEVYRNGVFRDRFPLFNSAARIGNYQLYHMDGTADRPKARHFDTRFGNFERKFLCAIVVARNGLAQLAMVLERIFA